ncbi:MAG TPA: adenosine monophosphate-protein transferase [Deltaproteobacteria bacterium]|nr:MAG: adenosine monophosphate-protein transferase [Deltaproteobacteria bacterium GWA2_55_82]OGQ64507.1 MAG: adenosine monophosphate-protein transferase [Deltaproteobacteria bacterium RIFCSPLOWO2_02_FULL_55_12]OIJ73632.1 MAG: adenosine monophosphate-protein transferase [Deltaproteobacteria bacterium GWC2_55_46]HBG47771.1 adenosine monophosphate-protein transferase [Deltaproteobacteria bacterium]HCY12007.1 adenosine monophosphate-protein transferase [Deltaproteobacteria bacterium]
MELKSIKVEIPEGANVIIGQTHFIKTVEDLYEIIRTTVPEARFGVALCEASGPCLIRVEGNDEAMKKSAADNAIAIGAGHLFVIILKGAFPINVLNPIKDCQEVCNIFCATANPLQVIVAKTDQGKGVVGVIDGFSPLMVESEKDREERKTFLRKIGYKL